MQPAHDDVPDSPVRVNGRRVGVSRFGFVGGWPVVWCHGGLSCRLDGRLLDAAGRRCGADIIAMDRPGIGRSDVCALSSIVQWAGQVEQVADQLGIGEFAVAGWSGGGPYALACAAAMPKRVRAVATLAGMAPLENLRDIVELGFLADVLLMPTARWSPRAAAALLWVTRWLPDRYLAWEVRRTAGSRDRTALDGEALQWLMAAVREATICGVRGTAEEYRRFSRPWGFDLRYVRHSVTMWQGEQDNLLPMSHARRLASELPSRTLKVVPLTGHYLPVVVADAVLEDLAP
jgi:pimeloyl-ACP methyl ester carboxylesterase